MTNPGRVAWQMVKQGAAPHRPPSPDEQARRQLARREAARDTVAQVAGALDAAERRLRDIPTDIVSNDWTPASANALRNARGQITSATAQLNSILKREKNR